MKLKLKLSHCFCLPWDVVGYESEVLVSSAQLQGPVQGDTVGSEAGSMMAAGCDGSWSFIKMKIASGP